jgi:hypothetical protein
MAAKTRVQYPIIHSTQRYINPHGVRFLLADEQRGKATRYITMKRPGVSRSQWSGVAGSYDEAIETLARLTA